MNLRGFLNTDRVGLAVFMAVLLLASAGAAYLALGLGANVNCAAGTCNSTNGNTDTTSPYDSNTVFTGDNDTASIEAAGGTYRGGGGNDTFYIRDPQTASKAVVEVHGEGGDDVILDGSTPDALGNALYGGDGNDFIAEDARGWLFGNDGNDLLAGGRDADCLEGNDDNDVLIGGPGLDVYGCNQVNGDVLGVRALNTATGDPGDDILIIHRGDVDGTAAAGGLSSGGEVIALGAPDSTEQWSCYDNDIVLLFGFNMDLVHILTSNTPAANWGFADGPCVTPGRACLADPVNNATGDAAGPQYRFNALADSHTCTIISVD